MKIISIARLLSAALVVFSATAWGGWIDDLKNKSTYDSSTGVYTLTGDFSVYSISGQDAKVDLNGHSFAFSGLSSNLELLNSSSTRAQVTINGNGLGSAGKTLVIGSGVDLLKLLSNSYKVFVGGTMKLCEGSRCYFEGTACVDKHDDDARAYFQVIFEKTANVIVEPGAMLKQYVDPNEAQTQADWYTWYNKEGFADLCVQEGWAPEGCNLQGPDADGYYLVVDAKYSSFNDLVAEYSDYNSSTDTYVLREDLNCFDGSLPDIDGCDISSVSESLKIDLNGHSVITEYINIGEQTLELKNSSSAQGYMSGFYDLAESGQLIIGNNVKFEDNSVEACWGLGFSLCHDNTWYGTIAVRNGGFFKNGQPFTKMNYGGWTQFNGSSLSFQVEVGAKFVSSKDSDGLKGMLDYGLWHLPADCKVVSLGNTEYDYGTTFLVKLSRELVSTDDCEFTIDTRTERTAVAGSTESFTIPDEVWEAAGENPVTVTYTKDGGAAQTLGTYKQGDKIEWIPTAGGNYTFTFGSSEYQASFHVDKTPGIFITSAKQRWPWNGMVDIGYFVEGLDPEKEYTATFHVTCKGETKSFTLAGIVNGDATTAWDAAAATVWGKTLVKEPATVSADLRCLTVKLPAAVRIESPGGKTNEFASLQAAINWLPNWHGEQEDDIPVIKMLVELEKHETTSIDLTNCHTDFLICPADSSSSSDLVPKTELYAAEKANDYYLCQAYKAAYDYDVESPWTLPKAVKRALAGIEISTALFYHYGVCVMFSERDDKDSLFTLQDALDSYCDIIRFLVEDVTLEAYADHMISGNIIFWEDPRGKIAIRLPLGYEFFYSYDDGLPGWIGYVRAFEMPVVVDEDK